MPDAISKTHTKADSSENVIVFTYTKKENLIIKFSISTMSRLL